MSYVYAAPPVAPPESVEQWVGVDVSWRGWDGSEWELTRPRSGVFLGSGIEGLNMPAHTPWTGSSPAVHGQFYRGYKVDPREVFLPLYVYSLAGSREWLERDRAFWRTMQPGMYGTLTAETLLGKRSLTVRFVDDGGHQYGHNPAKSGWASYGVTLVADDPFWYGTPHRRSWAQSAEQNFYGGAALVGPPFFIASASQLDSATISNEGDVEAWPVWTSKGPFTDLQVGVAGSVVEAPITANEGQTLVIDTDPTVQMAWLDGVDVTEQLGAADFAPIPAGEDRELSLTMTGTGSVEALVNPRHFKAW